MSDRYCEPFVTADSRQVIYVDAPLGLIAPPTISFHQPSVGPLTFYMASAYHLPVPKDPRR